MDNDEIQERLEIAKQQGEAKLIFAAADGEGNKHYIFGDEFANLVIHDLLEKLNMIEKQNETIQ